MEVNGNVCLKKENLLKLNINFIVQKPKKKIKIKTIFIFTNVEMTFKKIKLEIQRHFTCFQNDIDFET